MPYLGRSSQKAIRQRFIFTQSSAGATSISGADDSNATLRFDDGEYIDVILNGITLAKTEYNTLTANTIGGLSALSTGDVLQVTVYDMFNVADAVSASSGGTFNGGVTINNGSARMEVKSSGALTVSSATADATDKRAFFVTKHYSSSEEDAAAVIIQSVDGDTIVDVGGNNTSGYNAVTKIRFYTAANNTTTSGTEAARIDSSGSLLVNTTSRTGTSNFVVAADTSVENPVSIVSTEGGSTQRYAVIFYRTTSTIVGSIQITNSGTAYVTSSDYRLKENVSYTWDATARLKQLKPARFNFIADADTTVDGFLAHEVQTIVPEAVSGTKDATEKYTDEDGKEQTRIVPQGIDQAKLVPILVKTIQELEARITALENK